MNNAMPDSQRLHELLDALSQPKTRTQKEKERRIHDAAMALFISAGLKRTSMDDIARKAGSSRATLYRHYPDKGHLVASVVMRECSRSLTEILHTLKDIDGAREQLVEGFVLVVMRAANHPLINKLLDTEAEDILPFLTVRGADAFILGRWAFSMPGSPLALLAEQTGQDVAPVAEALMRMMHSFVLTPLTGTDTEKETYLRNFARLVIDRLLPA